MRIDSSTVAMNSYHKYTETQWESITVNTVNPNTASGKKDVTGGKVDLENLDQMNLSEKGKEQLKDLIPSENGNGIAENNMISIPDTNGGLNFNFDDDGELKLLEMMLRALGMGRQKDESLFSIFFSQKQSLSKSISVSAGQGTSRVPGVVTKQVKASSFRAETENTTFNTAGIARTKDGREITFNIDVEMSRSYAEFAQVEFRQNVKMVDPLVINLGPGVTTMSDKKFFFDLDGDGTKENISQLGSGSGFLAIDKNNDGIVNDGSELFGAKTGDGFGELSAYDDDGNGWIDENDAVFKDLKIWMKDEEDNDVLVAIGKAGLGAIYLGSVSTEFSLNSADTNAQNGQIRRTGFYLTEAGEARTVQHVDLAV